jgi:hypothetical protein
MSTAHIFSCSAILNYNLFCFISSQTTSFNPIIRLKEFAVAGPNPAKWLLAAMIANSALFLVY